MASGDIGFEIVRSMGILSETRSGWRKELNVVSWNGREPRYDIRSWSADHSAMTKGITLTSEEADRLRDLLEKEA